MSMLPISTLLLTYEVAVPADFNRVASLVLLTLGRKFLLCRGSRFFRFLKECIVCSQT